MINDEQQTSYAGNRTGGRRISILLTFGFAAVLLFFAFRGVQWREMVATAQTARLPYLLVASVVLTGAHFLRAVRWRVLLAAARHLTLLDVFWATAIGYLGNSFLPARAGEVIRSVLLSRRSGLSISYILATAFTERIADVLALVLMSVCAVQFLPDLPAWLLGGARAIAIVGIIGIIILVAAPRMQGVINWFLERLPLRPTWKTRLILIAEQFIAGMQPLQQWRRAVAFGGVTLIIWMLDAVVAIFIAQAFTLSLSLPQAVLFLCALGLSSAAPSTPGYVGIYQFVAVTVLTPFGFSRYQAIVYILVFQAVSYAVVTLWGCIGLTQLEGARLLFRNRRNDYGTGEV